LDGHNLGHVKTRRWECDRPGVEPTSSGCMTGDSTTHLKRSAVMNGTGIHRLIYRDICVAATAHNRPYRFRAVRLWSLPLQYCSSVCRSDVSRCGAPAVVCVGGGVSSQDKLIIATRRPTNEHGTDSLFYSAVKKNSLIAVLWHTSCFAN